MFTVKDVGSVSILGIRVKRNKNSLCLHQERVILRDILSTFNMNDCKPTNAPYAVALNLEKATSTDRPYQKLMFCFNYLAT